MSPYEKPVDEKKRVDYNKLVCAANAIRELIARDQNRALPLDIFGLLQECHRLSEAIKVEECASEDPISLTRTRVPHPKQIRVWRHFPELGDAVWNAMAEDGYINGQYVFPSPADCDVALEGMESVSSAKGVYVFRHMTVHRYMRLIWRKVMEDEYLRMLSLKEVSDILVDEDSFPSSEMHVKIERDANHCVFYCLVGRQRIPLFFVQYVAPQHLSVEQIAAGSKRVQNGNLSIAEGETHDPFLAALFQAFGYMVQNGIFRGIVDTGKTLMFLKISKKSPAVLKLHRHILHGDEVSEPDRYDLRHTVLSEYIALALFSIKDRAPTQQWWKIAVRLETCRVNAFSITKRVNPLRLHPAPSQAPVIRAYEGTAFCTSRCLAEVLAGGTRFDPECPNSEKHRQHGCGLNALEFMHALRHQLLTPTPTTELHPLHMRGRGHQYLRGVLEGYGYTFLVKMAEYGHAAELDDELEIFRALASLQGICIPVCIGMLDLDTTPGANLMYYGRFFHKMIVLSWEGLPVPLVFDAGGFRLLEKRRSEIREKIEALGVTVSRDISWKHLLWNKQSNRLILKNL
ncbi:hypothetical protein UA08_08165 [Talaromyces atroroseus]|uniref:Uncharacterized protein n=1 Tax=Talaromyces atroroseus TaxID=1441469 RepID=A0A225A755_TALAT|nr:hypothetical protein UA08_08165 [Talaromyces atroroseus]OKL56441.1 hypothetical protein UA08_08165 [Talaromyces atroroseus]